jgi:hypothetical protein
MRTQSSTDAAIRMLCIAILALHSFPMAIHGFANNLVGSSVGCMTELDTSEVIMNNVIKASEDSDFPNMHLVVLKDDNNMESPFHYTPSEEQLTIAFVNPYSKDVFPDDLQFVMDVEGPAEFVGGGTIGCEGNKRVAARLFDGGQVQLKLLDPTASLRIWAGWATGHEAVRLTPNLLLDPKPNVAQQSPEIQNEEIPEKVAGHLKERELKGRRDAPVKGERSLPASPTTPEIVEKDTPDKTVKSGKKSHQMKFREKGKRSDKKKWGKIEKLKEIKKEVDDKKLHSDWAAKIRDKMPLRDPKELVDATKIIKNLGLANIKKLAVEDKEADIDDDDAPAEKPKLMDEEERRKKLSDEMMRNFPEKGIHGLLARYESDSFGGGLNMSGYYCGCAFFIFSFGTLLSLLLRRKEKGRRDL